MRGGSNFLPQCAATATTSGSDGNCVGGESTEVVGDGSIGTGVNHHHHHLLRTEKYYCDFTTLATDALKSGHTRV